MQQPVGENMPALGIGAELDFVHHQAGHRNFQRHGFDGADIEARALGHDLLFAGDQGDLVGAFEAHDAVIDFARQEPQRQADHAGAVRQHPLDGEKGLAGVGGAQDRADFGCGRGSLGHGFNMG